MVPSPELKSPSGGCCSFFHRNYRRPLESARATKTATESQAGAKKEKSSDTKLPHIANLNEERMKASHVAGLSACTNALGFASQFEPFPPLKWTPLLAGPPPHGEAEVCLQGSLVSRKLSRRIALCFSQEGITRVGRGSQEDGDANQPATKRALLGPTLMQKIWVRDSATSIAARPEVALQVPGIHQVGGRGCNRCSLRVLACAFFVEEDRAPLCFVWRSTPSSRTRPAR